jgi:hypothetical protein
MSSPLILPHGFEHTDTERSQPLISGEIVESTFYCKLKAYLKLDGQSGMKSCDRSGHQVDPENVVWG